jgi:hypothetical protein
MSTHGEEVSYLLIQKRFRTAIRVATFELRDMSCPIHPYCTVPAHLSFQYKRPHKARILEMLNIDEKMLLLACDNHLVHGWSRVI